MKRFFVVLYIELSAWPWARTKPHTFHTFEFLIVGFFWDLTVQATAPCPIVKLVLIMCLDRIPIGGTGWKGVKLEYH